MATRNKVSCRDGVTIHNRDPTTNTDLQILHILFLLGTITVVDLLTPRSGNGDMTNW